MASLCTPLVDQLRPFRFEDLAQDPADPAMRLLRSAALAGGGRLLLIHGAPGCGKTASARVFARSLACTGRDATDCEPCGSCKSCATAPNSRRWSDNGIVEFDCARGTPNELLDRLEEQLRYVSCFDVSRRDEPVVLLDEVHRNEGRLGDRLLKLLEDHSRVCFCLITSEPKKLTPALRQRCRGIHIVAPSEARCIGWLDRCGTRLGWTLLPGTAQDIAREAQCVPRQALQILESAAGLAGERISLDDVRQAVTQFVV